MHGGDSILQQTPRTPPADHPQTPRTPPGADFPANPSSLEDPETTVDHADEESSHADYPPPPDDSATAFVHSGWAPLRRQIRAALITCEAPTSRVGRFDYCGRDSYVYGRFEGGKLADLALRGSCCRDRFCLVCGRIRSAAWASKTRRVLEGEKPALFITLTLGGNSDESLRDKLDRLYAGFRALRQLPLFQRRVRGGVAFLEVKHSGKRWHPHLHLLADGDYLDQAALSDMWRAITGDSWIVDIRRVRDANKATSYVAKYASKPMSNSFAGSHDLLCEAIRALKGRRLVLTFGKFHGEKLKLSEAEEFDATEIITTWSSLGRLDSLCDRAATGEEFAAFVLANLERLERRARRDSG